MARHWLTLLLLAAVLVPAAPALAQDPPPSDAAAQEDADKFEIKKEIYDYSSSHRRDPFLSMIEKAIRDRKKQDVKTKVPLESYALKQMRIIAIVSDRGGSYALVGLPDGKFYTVKKGTNVGIHNGFVHQINSDSIVVREQISDFKGRLTNQDAVLRLRKEE